MQDKKKRLMRKRKKDLVEELLCWKSRAEGAIEERNRAQKKQEMYRKEWAKERVRKEKNKRSLDNYAHKIVELYARLENNFDMMREFLSCKETTDKEKVKQLREYYLDDQIQKELDMMLEE